MPLLDYRRLRTVQEYRRAFLILCMVSHSYVWGKHETASEVKEKNQILIGQNLIFPTI